MIMSAIITCVVIIYQRTGCSTLACVWCYKVCLSVQEPSASPCVVCIMEPRAPLLTATDPTMNVSH